MANSPNDQMSAALAAHLQGQLDVAQRLYLRILKRHPDYVPALCHLGISLLQQGKAAQARTPLATAVKAQPGSFDALAHYGLALAMSGEGLQALSYLDRALAIRPDDVNALLNRGNALKLLGRHQEAIATYDAAIKVAPNNAELHNNRGTELVEIGSFEEAIASYDRALAINPRHVDALNNRGSALSRLDRLPEAIAHYDRALALNPNHANALANRGDALVWLNRTADALASFQRALALQPSSAELHFAIGFALLRQGEFRQGFREYEWRLQRGKGATAPRKFGRSPWRGDSPLAGKTILLHGEQGFGDTIQFLRYVPLIARAGAKVVLEVQPQLKALLANFPGAMTVVGFGESLPPFDLHCPLPSLPLALGTEMTNIPAETPYIAAPANCVAAWRDRVPLARRRIGIVWCGNPNFLHDRHRSMGLAQIAPLFEASDVAFVSINPGLAREDIDNLATLPNVTHLGDQMRDFTDTAAVLDTLDLLITTDTASAHLGGAMGKPTWIMLAKRADWRWLIDRDDSPWYPSVRLFRQERLGDWDGVLERIADALKRDTPPQAP